MTRRFSLRGAALFFLCLMPFMLVRARAGAEVCMALVALLFLFHSRRAKDWAWLRSGLTPIALFTWAWIVLVVSPLAIAPGPSFARAVVWIRYPLFFLAVTHWVLKDMKFARIAGLVVAGLLAFIFADTLLQCFHGVELFGNLRRPERLSGPFTTISVGTFTVKMMVPTLGFLTWLALVEKKKRAAAGWVAGLLALIVMILLSGERAALMTSLLAIALAGLVSAACYPRARAWLLAGGFLLSAGFVTVWATQPPVQRRMEFFRRQIAHFPESPYGRVTPAATILGERYWLHGVGMHDFEQACIPLKTQEHLVAHCEMHARNPYMEWLAECGVVGLACFLALIAWLVHRPLKLMKRRDHYRPVMAAFSVGTLLVHFFPFMFLSSTVSNWPAMLLWLSLALNTSFTQRAEEF